MPIVELVGTVGTLIAIFLLYLKFKPNAKNASSRSFIDFPDKKVVEEKDFAIYWGCFLFGRKIKLPKTARKSEVKVFCKPLATSKQFLPSDYYEQISKGQHTLISLTEKRYFKEKEIRDIYLETITPISDSFQKNITHEIKGNTITIKNNDLVEIRNYPITLPLGIDLPKITTFFEHISKFENPKKPSEGIKIFVSKVPPKQGNNPGTKIIPIS